MTTSLTGSPHPRSRSYQPDWVSGALGGAVSPGSGMPAALGSLPGTASPCTISPSGRLAVLFGSFCRRDPAAALRGLANSGLPASPTCSLSSWNPATGKKTSPRTSSSAGTSGPVSRDGTAPMVRMLGVMSSPAVPSPRVAPRTSAPFRYTRATASPSIFTSHRYGPVPPSLVARAAHASSSSAEKALSRLSIRSRWRTGVNWVDTPPPGRWVGESGVRSSGYCSSSARISRMSWSYSASETSGESRM